MRQDLELGARVLVDRNVRSAITISRINVEILPVSVSLAFGLTVPMFMIILLGKVRSNSCPNDFSHPRRSSADGPSKARQHRSDARHCGAPSGTILRRSETVSG